MNSYYHAVSAAKKYGGTPEEYLEIESFIDSSKSVIGDIRHRSIYHHTLGIFLCEKLFGTTLTVDKEGLHPREIPVRLIAELHIIQDLGWIPSPADYIKDMPVATWMGGAVRREKNLSDLFIDKATRKPVEHQQDEFTDFIANLMRVHGINESEAIELHNKE